MNGRLEQELLINQRCQKTLDKCPEYVVEWYNNLRASDKTAMSCRNFLNNIYRFLSTLTKDTCNIRVEQLSYNTVSNYFISIQTKTKISNGQKETVETSDSYKQGVWCALNNFFTFLQKRKYIEDNPMELIEKPANHDADRINKNRILLQEDDFKKILKSVERGCGSQRSMAFQEKMKNRDMVIFLIFMTTGIRKTALSEINIEDINFDTRELVVKDKGKKTHSYFLTPLTMDYINEWLLERKEIANENSMALFVSNRGKRISGRAIDNLVQKYCDDALGYHISPHKLRAGFCSIMYNKTGDIEKVRRMVGHSRVDTTQRYIVTGGNEKEEASAIMTDIFG